VRTTQPNIDQGTTPHRSTATGISWVSLHKDGSLRWYHHCCCCWPWKASQQIIHVLCCAAAAAALCMPQSQPFGTHLQAAVGVDVFNVIVDNQLRWHFNVCRQNHSVAQPPMSNDCNQTLCMQRTPAVLLQALQLLIVFTAALAN
jgi:hypothetical protein